MNSTMFVNQTHIIADQRGFSAGPNNPDHPAREQSGLVAENESSTDHGYVEIDEHVHAQ